MGELEVFIHLKIFAKHLPGAGICPGAVGAAEDRTDKVLLAHSRSRVREEASRRSNEYFRSWQVVRGQGVM